MMKKLAFMAACVLSMMAIACTPDNPEEEQPKNSSAIVGEWQLSEITTKATIGDQTVNVYVSFTADSNFELYQQLGTGWYHYYSGTWTLEKGVLSGVYSNGKAWGSTYSVSFNGDKMVLTTPSGTETDTYTKTTIPAEVKKKTEY